MPPSPAISFLRSVICGRRTDHLVCLREGGTAEVVGTLVYRVHVPKLLREATGW